MAKFGPRKLTKFFIYLDNLRNSGATNMFGAAPYLSDAFGLPIKDAREVLGMWSRTFSDEPASKRASQLGVGLT